MRPDAAQDDAKPPFGFPHAPAIRTVAADDIVAAFRAGVADFLAAPQFGLFFASIYVIGGLGLLACLRYWNEPLAIIPLAIAFPLVGPFVAVGLYEVSRRLSTGEPLAWGPILSVVWEQRRRELGWMAFVMLFVYWMWAYNVRLLLALFLQSASFSSLETFFTRVIATENGLLFLGVGTVIGAGIALILYSITVIAMPLLVDRDIDIVTALVSSVTAVRRSPAPMIGWGLFILVAMLISLAPMFLGLFLTLPIFGHATWRLYERTVVR